MNVIEGYSQAARSKMTTTESENDKFTRRLSCSFAVELWSELDPVVVLFGYFQASGCQIISEKEMPITTD
jgi:hypothetical protein